MGKKKPSSIVMSIVSAKINAELEKNSQLSVEDALANVVVANDKYDDFDWEDKAVSEELQKKVKARRPDVKMTAPSSASKTTGKKFSEIEQIKLKGKATMSRLPDGRVLVEGGKEATIGCKDNATPVKEEVSKGKNILGCEENFEEEKI